MITIGLDLSLCKTGFSVIEDGKVMAHGTIKSSPDGHSPRDEARRLKELVEEIFSILETILDGKKPDLVVVEGIAFMARKTTAVMQLATLNYCVRMAMLEPRDWEMLIVSPLSVKKFIIGVGKAEKSLMMMTVLRDYGFESYDDNECDSFALATIGHAYLGKPIIKLGQPQKEVLKVLNKKYE